MNAGHVRSQVVDCVERFVDAANSVETQGNFGAGNEARTRDLNLGKVALYQLSYSRPIERRNCRAAPPGVKKKPLRNDAKALNCPAIPAMPRADTGPLTKASEPPQSPSAANRACRSG